jgi:hypothetical protein
MSTPNTNLTVVSTFVRNLLRKHWNLTIASPFPKEDCNSESYRALIHHKYEVLPVFPSGSKRKMNKEQGWDDSNRETPKGLTIDLSIFTLSTINPT